jgi:carboxylesterase
MPEYLKGAAPFELAGGPRGVLLIHGFTGSPHEMRPLGGALAARGYTVAAPALAGHATSPEDLEWTKWTDWYGTAQDALDRLKGRCERVFAAGLSMGGLLAAKLAADRPADVAALAVLAAPLYLSGLNGMFATAARFSPMRYFLPMLPKLKSADPRIRAIHERHPSYGVIPTRAAASLWNLMMIMRLEMPRVRAPALLVYSKSDGEVPYVNMHMASALIGSERLSRLTLLRSSHLLTLDLEAETVCAEVAGFFDRH